MIYQIPEVGNLELKTIILDINGTLAVNGKLVVGCRERIDKLKDMGYKIVLFTGNTLGNGDAIAAELGVEWHEAKSGLDKKEGAEKLEPETCVAIGNGLNDLELMKIVKFKIATLQAEGAHVQTLLAADVLAPSINDALDLLINADTLKSTLRK